MTHHHPYVAKLCPQDWPSTPVETAARMKPVSCAPSVSMSPNIKIIIIKCPPPMAMDFVTVVIRKPSLDFIFVERMKRLREMESLLKMSLRLFPLIFVEELKNCLP